MSIDITLLRLGKDRKQFDRLDPGLPIKALQSETQTIWSSLRAFYKEFPDVKEVDIDYFRTWFTEFKHATLDGDLLDLLKARIGQMKEPVPDELREGLMSRMLTSELAVETISLLEKYNSGDEVDLVAELSGALDAYNDRLERKTKMPLVVEDIDELMADDETNSGITYRLAELRRSMRPLRGGDFGIFAGRPDRGKTTGIASEVSYWVPQIKDLYPGEGRVGIWLNNEGPGKRIKQRYYQAALGCTLSEMVDMHKEGRLHANLVAALGEDYKTSMLFYDIHDFYSHEVEGILKQHKPAFVIFDMIDNIRFSGTTSNNGQRTDQLLEEMYKWGRNLAVRYDFAGIATSQISGDGDGVPYPPQTALKDSKTGKQGACDFIIMLGALNDPNMDRSRYLGIPKNKLHRETGPKNPQVEIMFDALRARLESPE